jgi:hypothetical protein
MSSHIPIGAMLFNADHGGGGGMAMVATNLSCDECLDTGGRRLAIGSIGIS